MSKNIILVPSAEMKEWLYKEWFGDDDRAFGKGRINAFADAYLKLASPLLPQQEDQTTVECYGIYRKRDDENDGQEYFHSALWHNETAEGDGDRIIKGRFVPDAAVLPQVGEVTREIVCGCEPGSFCRQDAQGRISCDPEFGKPLAVPASLEEVKAVAHAMHKGVEFADCGNCGAQVIIPVDIPLISKQIQDLLACNGGLYQVLLDAQNGIDSPATAGMANKAICTIDKIHVSWRDAAPIAQALLVVADAALNIPDSIIDEVGEDYDLDTSESINRRRRFVMECVAKATGANP